MQQRGEQFDLAALTAARGDGVTDDLAVHGHRDQFLGTVLTHTACAVRDRGGHRLGVHPRADLRIGCIGVDVVGYPARRRFAGRDVLAGHRMRGASRQRE